MKHKLSLAVLSAFALSCSGTLAFADIISFEVIVNTSSLNGTTGYVELQLQPGTLLPAPVTASISGFQGASLNSTDQTFPSAGNFTGSLDNNNLTLANYSGSSASPAFGPADYVEAAAFNSNRITFFVTLDGVGASTPGATTSGTQFAIDLFDSTGSNYLLTTDPTAVNLPDPDPDYYAGVIDIDSQGNVNTNGSGGGANDVVFAGEVSQVPEPAAFPSVAFAVGATLTISALRRRRALK